MDTRQLDDAVAALDQAQRAVGTKQRLLEARVNLALALEAVSAAFQQDATKAWEEYLKLDSTSGPAVEIKRHLETHKRDPVNSLFASTIRSRYDAVGTSLERK